MTIPGEAIPKTQVLRLPTNVAGMLCYLPLFGICVLAPILWLVTEPRESRFVRFHAIQSLLLSVAVPVLFVALGWGEAIVVVLFDRVSVQLADIVALVATSSRLGSLVLAGGAYVLLMIGAYRSTTPKLPVLGRLAERWA